MNKISLEILESKVGREKEHRELTHQHYLKSTCDEHIFIALLLKQAHNDLQDAIGKTEMVLTALWGHHPISRLPTSYTMSIFEYRDHHHNRCCIQ